MSSHRLTTGGTFVLLSLLGAAAAFGQPHPFDMDSGVRGWSGPGSVTLTGTNSTRFFILTDIEFSASLAPGDVSEVTLIIDSANIGQRLRQVQVINYPTGASFQTVPISLHLTTGIAFPVNDEVIVRVEGIPSNRIWYVHYSGYHYDISAGAVGEQSPTVAPSRLGQNVPNPFNPTTNITYSLATAGDVKLRFFDSSGRMVRTLVDGKKNAGDHTVTWDGRNDSGQPLPSGVYYYELGGNVRSESRKAILLK
jgi:hypothetical protein